MMLGIIVCIIVIVPDISEGISVLSGFIVPSVILVISLRNVNTIPCYASMLVTHEISEFQ